MSNVYVKSTYNAFGLSIRSEIPLPELIQLEEKKEGFDVEIIIEDLSLKWNEIASSSNNEYIVCTKTKQVMYKIKDIAIFAITEGKRIAVFPLKKYQEDIARLVILGSCMGALLMQRKILPLHGSAVAINGKAYAIIGESGAGKSTLALTFLKEGFQILTDDVVAVSLSNDKIPNVIPSYPQQKLWEESLYQFGMQTTGYSPVYQRQTKFAIPIPSQFSSVSLPLAGIFELDRTGIENIKIKSVKGLERFQSLFFHTYRNFLVSPLGLLNWHFNISANVIHQTEMYKLSRPDIDSFTAYDLLTHILNSINLEEKGNDQ